MNASLRRAHEKGAGLMLVAVGATLSLLPFDRVAAANAVAEPLVAHVGNPAQTGFTALPATPGKVASVGLDPVDPFTLAGQVGDNALPNFGIAGASVSDAMFFAGSAIAGTALIVVAMMARRRHRRRVGWGVVSERALPFGRRDDR